MNRIEIFEMKMPQLNRQKTIRLWLPKGYEEGNKTYPVLYMHDGQNLFDGETASFGVAWEVGKTLDALQEGGEIEGFIVVGLDNNNDDPEKKRRLDEYSPWGNPNLQDLREWNPPILSIPGGEGSDYVDFIVQTLKPYIDDHYRTKTSREDTWIAGSSMGGFISLYAGFQYPEVFSKIGTFSTACWFEKGELFQFIREKFGKQPMKIYMDIGTNETSNHSNPEFPSIYLNDSIELEELLLELGQSKEDLLHVIDEGAQHNEAAWAKRFPRFIQWMMET